MKIALGLVTLLVLSGQGQGHNATGCATGNKDVDLMFLVDHSVGGFGSMSPYSFVKMMYYIETVIGKLCLDHTRVGMASFDHESSIFVPLAKYGKEQLIEMMKIPNPAPGVKRFGGSIHEVVGSRVDLGLERFSEYFANASYAPELSHALPVLVILMTGPYNGHPYSNPEMDKMVEKARDALRKATKDVYYHDILIIAAGDDPTPLSHLKKLTGPDPDERFYKYVERFNELSTTFVTDAINLFRDP